MSFYEVSGDLFESKAEVWVNPVNCEGVMGKGIALEFKRRFPAMFEYYRVGCEMGFLSPGDILAWENPDLHPKLIVNLATKGRWRNPSRAIWIHDGIMKTMDEMVLRHLKSVAIPALGCGEGRLEYSDVYQVIRNASYWEWSIDKVDICLYKPFDRG